MTREQAIELARVKKLEHPGTFHKLRPIQLPNGAWVVEVFLTPLFGFQVASAAEFEPALQLAFEQE